MYIQIQTCAHMGWEKSTYCKHSDVEIRPNSVIYQYNFCQITHPCWTFDPSFRTQANSNFICK